MMVGAAVSVVAFGPQRRRAQRRARRRTPAALLSAHDVQAALGGTVADGSLTTAPDGTQSVCDWVVTLSSSRGYGVQLDVYSGRTAAAFAWQHKVARGRTRTIKHLGDGAFSERAVVAGYVFDDLWVQHATINF